MSGEAGGTWGISVGHVMVAYVSSETTLIRNLACEEKIKQARGVKKIPK